jgi:hypothetical protein
VVQPDALDRQEELEPLGLPDLEAFPEQLEHPEPLDRLAELERRVSLALQDV